MDLKNKVVNLEIAKHLKELGIEQKSIIKWLKWIPKKGCSYTENEWKLSFYRGTEGKYEWISAFNSDELMDLLPSFIDTKKGEPYNNFGLEIYKRSAKNIQYIVKYVCDTMGVDRYGSLAKVTLTNRNIYDENLSNAIAKMLILLIEENLYVKREPIDIEEVL